MTVVHTVYEYMQEEGREGEKDEVHTGYREIVYIGLEESGPVSLLPLPSQGLLKKKKDCVYGKVSRNNAYSVCYALPAP